MSAPDEIRYTDEAVDDIRALRKYDQQQILDGIELRLTDQPRLESKRRIRALVQPFWSQ